MDPVWKAGGLKRVGFETGRLKKVVSGNGAFSDVLSFLETAVFKQPYRHNSEINSKDSVGCLIDRLGNRRIKQHTTSSTPQLLTP